MRVLLVDDEAAFARPLAERLELRGMETGVALDAEAALVMLAEGEWDLVFLDVGLPGMDGVTLLKILRERCQTVLERFERVGREACGHLRGELLLQRLTARDDRRRLVRAHEPAAAPVAGVARAQQVAPAHEIVHVERHDARLELPVRADVARGVQPRIVGQKEQNVHGILRHVQLRTQRLHDGGVSVEDAARVGIDLRCVEHDGRLPK